MRGAAAARRAAELLELVGIPAARAAAARVPAPALRRHAAAGDDRDGGGLPAAAARRRRADHRARRDRAGRHPRRAARPARRDRHRGPAHHARSRRGGRHRRPGRGHVRRADHRGGRTRTRCSRGTSHPYTRGLLDAVPNPARHADGGLREIPGRVPTMRVSPEACTFADRCGYADELCRTNLPQLEPGPGRSSGALLPSACRTATEDAS